MAGGAGAIGAPRPEPRAGAAGDPAARRAAAAVSLPILKAGGCATKPGHHDAHGAPKSRIGPWRAAVLVGIHLIFLAHLAQWLNSGLRDGVRSTLSPVEPSESMFTLELGQLNAGFVMFAVAIVATLIFGRFFCGWACHIVALQDFCGWLMKKAGVHPKPWRTRLLLGSTVALALYMFVWPTFRREVLARFLGEAVVIGGKTRHVLSAAWAAWLGDVRPWPANGLEPHFMVENFWATFAPWPIAIPFLFACGFATVYFLGAKGFCTYGCPYGGVFAPVDTLSPFRIRVTDACEQCGHCTAVCTSNVRVHEEVRDFGAVVDPGCMKCMDCVSVCPKDALYVGFGLPAVLTKARVGAAEIAESKRRKRARYDMTLREEIVIGAALFVLVVAYRGLYGAVPLLMAMGLAAIVAFMVHRCWRMLRDANVRAPLWQLKLKGAVTWRGRLFAVATVLLLVVAAQGLALNITRWWGDSLYDRLMQRPGVARSAILTPNYAAAPEDAELAQRALARLRVNLPTTDGGINFADTATLRAKLVWLNVITGDLPRAERDLSALIERAPDSRDVVLLAQIMSLRGAPEAEFESAVAAKFAAHPMLEDARRWLAQRQVGRGEVAAAEGLYRAAVERQPRHLPTLRGAVAFWLAVERGPEAVSVARTALERLPDAAALHLDLATALAATGDQAGAMKEAERASELEQDAPEPLSLLATLYDARREPARAEEFRQKAAALAERRRAAAGGIDPLVSPTQNPN
ncbi:hypothetical protein BH11PLA1_BH11PLA1_10380 [soil metagenome]